MLIVSATKRVFRVQHEESFVECTCISCPELRAARAPTKIEPAMAKRLSQVAELLPGQGLARPQWKPLKSCFLKFYTTRW